MREALPTPWTAGPSSVDDKAVRTRLPVGCGRIRAARPTAPAGIAGVDDPVAFGDADYRILTKAPVTLGGFQACGRGEQQSCRRARRTAGSPGLSASRYGSDGVPRDRRAASLGDAAAAVPTAAHGSSRRRPQHRTAALAPGAAVACSTRHVGSLRVNALTDRSLGLATAQPAKEPPRRG